MRIPTDATPSMQQALREVWAEIRKLSELDVNMHGRRVVNASAAVGSSDYMTRSQVRDYVKSAQFASDVQTVIVQDGGGDTDTADHQFLSPTHVDTSPAGPSRGDIVVVNSSGLWARLAKGSAGQALTSDGTDVAWATHNLLSATHGDALAGTVVRGDVIVGNATPKWSRLAKGSAGQILISDGTDVAYGTSLASLTFTTSDVVAGINGSTWTRSYTSESISFSGASATADSSANLLPANSIIDAVVARVTTAVTFNGGATTWTIGDAGDADRFTGNNAGAAGTTAVGLNQHDPAASTGPQQVSAAQLRLTAAGGLGTFAGTVRCVVFYHSFVAPTS